jgi:alpha-L-arabinofuranosidase
MAGAGLKAVNSLMDPMRVTPKKGSGAAAPDDALTAKLPRHSYQMIRLSLS